MSDLRGTLNEKETELLSTTSLNKETILDIRTSSCRLGYQLKWQQELAERQNGNTGLQPHPKTGYLVNPPASNELEAKLQLSFDTSFGLLYVDC